MANASWIDETLAAYPAVMTLAQVREVLPFSQRHLYRLVAGGQLCASQFAAGGSAKWMIPKAELAQFLRESFAA